jgi:hypothetical protein
MSEKITNHFKMTRAVIDDAESAALEAASEHLHQLDSLRLECSELTAENARLSLENAESRKAATELPAGRFDYAEADAAEFRRLLNLDMMSLQMPDGYVAETIEQALRGWKAGYDNAVAELAHVREQLASTLCALEHAAVDAASNAFTISRDLSNPQVGKLLVVRVDKENAAAICGNETLLRVANHQWVGWLEAAQDEGDTETKPVDVHHAGMPSPVVRCGDCTATVGHFGDCAKAVAP